MAIWLKAIPALLLCVLTACGKPQQDAKSEGAGQLNPQLLGGEQSSGKPVMGEHASTLDKDLIAPVVDLETLAARAKQGDTSAQYDLGLRYAQGNGVAKNQFMAVDWFRAAAEKGHPQAQFEMGSATLTGEGARPSIKEAARWYRQAAPSMPEADAAADYLEAINQGTHGQDDQLHQAMWLHDNGDDTKALEKFEPLAENGNILAAYFVGKIDQGFADALADESEADYATLQESALKWHRKAAEGGFVWAQLDLAEIHLERSWTEGEDDPAEVAEARRWYEAAAKQGSKAGTEGLLLLDAERISDAEYEKFEATREAPRTEPAPPAAPETFQSPFPPVATSPSAGPAPPAQPGHSLDGRSDLQICGRMWGEWQWYTGTIPGVLTFDDQNRVGASPARGAPQMLAGTWTCEPATASFTITWPNGVIETYTMAADGSSVSGQNNYGSPIKGTPLR